MANPKHKKIFWAGPEEWNKWRESTSEIADLSGIRIVKKKLEGYEITSTDLSNSLIQGSTFSECEFRDVNAKNSHWKNSQFVNTQFRDMNISKSLLFGIVIKHSRMSDTRFDDCDGYQVEFIDLAIKHSSFKSMIVHSFSSLFLCRFRSCDFTKMEFDGDVSDCEFRDSELSDFDLSHCFIDGTVFRHSELAGCDVTNAMMMNTLFDGIDMSKMIGLESVDHSGSNTLSHNTLYRSGNSIPLIFLQAIGLPENLIEYLPSLIGTPIEYYTCFISYSSKNHEFAHKLYKDLLNNGVRCWIASEDMKIGSRIRTTIHDSIKMYDKLLLVLSDESVASDWVEDEVETAFEKERKSQNDVLFPVTIDRVIQNTNVAWAEKIRNTRHVGDFTKWKEYDPYKKSFDRLLRDLKSGQSMSQTKS